MSNPVLAEGVPIQSFASAVLSVPHLAVASTAGVQSGFEQIRQEAQRQGYEEGFVEGRSGGYEVGVATGHQAGLEAAKVQTQAALEAQEQEMRAELARIANEVAECYTAWLAAAEAAMTDRVIEAVREVTSAELAMSRQGALAIVQSCLGQLSHARNIRIRLNSVDAPAIDRHRERLSRELDGEPIELVRDESITAGVIIESTAGTVDGRIETRLELIEEAWIAETAAESLAADEASERDQGESGLAA